MDRNGSGGVKRRAVGGVWRRRIWVWLVIGPHLAAWKFIIDGGENGLIRAASVLFRREFHCYHHIPKNEKENCKIRNK